MEKLKGVNHLENPKPAIEVKHGTRMGKHVVFFTVEDYFVNLAEDCKLTLVGRFLNGKPAMEDIRRSFISQFPMKGTIKIAYFDPKHVYLDFTTLTDYNFIYFKRFINLAGCTMKLGPWTPDFVPEIETPLAPVWILLHQLPWHLYK